MRTEAVSTRRAISFTLRLMVMTLIMNRNDGGRRVPGAEAKRLFQNPVPTTAGKCGAMNLVMFDNAGNEREHTGQQEKRPVPDPTSPLHHEESDEQHQENQRTPIRSIPQRNESFPIFGLHDG